MLFDKACAIIVQKGFQQVAMLFFEGFPANLKNVELQHPRLPNLSSLDHKECVFEADKESAGRHLGAFIHKCAVALLGPLGSSIPWHARWMPQMDQ